MGEQERECQKGESLSGHRCNFAACKQDVRFHIRIAKKTYPKKGSVKKTYQKRVLSESRNQRRDPSLDTACTVLLVQAGQPSESDRGECALKEGVLQIRSLLAICKWEHLFLCSDRENKKGRSAKRRRCVLRHGLVPTMLF
jgi:hypothetical protein